MSFSSHWSHTHFTKPLLAIAIGSAISAAASAAGPTVYGKIHLTAHQYDLEKINFQANDNGFSHFGGNGIATELDTVALESTGSRLGIVGDFQANADIQVFYRLEYGVDVDNGTNSNGREFSQRNIFAGVRGKWGSLLAGKNDTPLKTLQTNVATRSDVDRFNDLPLGDIGTFLVGENRPDNVIQYTSPTLLGGLTINIAAIQGEESGVAVNANNPQDDNGFASGSSVSVTYGKPTWYVGVGVDTNVATSDVVRAVGEITLGNIKLGAIAQSAEAHDAGDSLGGFSSFVGTSLSSVGAQNGANPVSEWDGTNGNAFSEQEGYVLNAQWTVAGPWVVKAQYANSTTTPSNAVYSDVELEGVVVGVDYNINKDTRVFITHASVEAQGDLRISPYAVTDSTTAVGFDFRF